MDNNENIFVNNNMCDNLGIPVQLCTGIHTFEAQQSHSKLAPNTDEAYRSQRLISIWRISHSSQYGGSLIHPNMADLSFIPIWWISHDASNEGSITPLYIILFLPKIHRIWLLLFEV